MSLPPLLAQPAGFSSDTLEQPSPSLRDLGTDDSWSDVHDIVETDDERDVIEEVSERQDDITIRPHKVNAPSDKTHEMHAPSPTATAPSSTSMQDLPPLEADPGSLQSIPVVQVTEPTNPSPAPPSHCSTSSSYPVSPTASLAPTTASSLDRRTRNRTTMDTRTSNRISGFFTSLIHRRDHAPPPTRESMTPTPPPPPRESSRTSSPLPSRAPTPPPALPPPSITDLGLSLSPVTSMLAPSHFSSPPCSGAFLQPHYLLLCHAQGLDVLPLVSPPAPQPYSLIRRVPFKSVVVMEHRGVLVAIAGRRDGVRVYALEEVKRAVEWRIEMEVKRERERNRREELKRALVASHESREKKIAAEKEMRGKNMPPFPSNVKSRPDRRATVSVSSPSTPTTPRASQPRRPKTPPPLPMPSGPPPAYTPSNRSRTNTSVPFDSSHARARTTSVNDVLAGTLRRGTHTDNLDEIERGDVKNDWGSSDDEAIDPVTAPSGSQALDERTSTTAMHTTRAPTSGNGTVLDVPNLPRTSQARRRPANLDLTLTRAAPPVDAIATTAPPSPTPTLLSLRQALMSSPGSGPSLPSRDQASDQHSSGRGTAEGEPDDDEEENEHVPSSPTTPTRERISLAEALMESRLPELPPAGSQRSQTAILLSSVGTEDETVASPRTSESFSTQTRRSMGDASTRRRRRWSVFDGIFQPSSTAPTVPSVQESTSAGPASRAVIASQPEMRERRMSQLSRSHSTRAASMPSNSVFDTSNGRPSTAPGRELSPRIPLMRQDTMPSPPVTPQPTSGTSSRFLPRIITNAFQSRRSEDQPGSPRTHDHEGRKSLAGPNAGQAPAPKLEYVKLPGTKGSIMVKAVETAKKSFLAILCGDNGEKVELFAGTYRTALGLSRTFILPDSPRSLELQLQGDDLVEVFLVFSQNVFGLEPATVRVREVRIGRAERRAARRRLRETQQISDPADPEGHGGDDDTAVNVTIGVAVASPGPTGIDDPNQGSPLGSPLPGATHPADTQAAQGDTTAIGTSEELITLAAAQSSPYTTFQQLTFAPNFPLASIAEEYIIPPTYPSFLEYRSQYEQDVAIEEVDLAQVQFSPPGLPVPAPAPPSQWFYRDPKGIVHGPWQASLMQTWYKDGLLPPDLPVRREEDQEYTLLRDLRLQCVDPTHPFRSSPPLPPSPAPSAVQLLPNVDPTKPLLPPISVLAQPKHFGPPALFFSSRGGHSTAIVDARGRSVLKSKFMWSPDEEDDNDLYTPATRLGDVKRIEAFDVQDRAVLVAIRQGGLEAVDFGDALLLPADHSRTMFPHFHPPQSVINRRGPFVWKIGTETSSQANSPLLPALPPKLPNRFHGKKQSTGPAKSPGRPDVTTSGDGDAEHQRDEMFFLGRKEDVVYFCEKRFGSFRILRISPASSAASA